MGTNYVPLLTDMFLYSYEVKFMQFLLLIVRKRLLSLFNFTYRYIDDVLSIYNPDFENYLGNLYPLELEIKDTTESNTSASYLDYSCQSLGTINFALPITTSMTILISILKKISVSELQHPIFACLWRFNLTTRPIRQGLLLL